MLQKYKATVEQVDKDIREGLASWLLSDAECMLCYVMASAVLGSTRVCACVFVLRVGTLLG